jgi:hypothetical protein
LGRERRVDVGRATRGGTGGGDVGGNGGGDDGWGLHLTGGGEGDTLVVCANGIDRAERNCIGRTRGW